MKHALVAEFRQCGQQWIESLFADGFFGELAVRNGSNSYFIRCKYSGRLDEVRLITQETEVHGVRYNGQIVAIDDSFAVDGLVMYVRHNIDFRRRCNGALHDPDPSTLFWHWATKETYDRPSDNRECFVACLQSLNQGNKR